MPSFFQLTWPLKKEDCKVSLLFFCELSNAVFFARPSGRRVWLCPAGRVTLVKVGRPGHVTRSDRGRGSVAAGRSVEKYRCCRALRV